MKNKAGIFLSIALILFILIAFLLGLNHELWRDEIQVYLFCRDSHSLRDLIFNIRYEGHTYLWYFSVYAVSRFFDSPVCMQILHVCIACGSAFIILFYSPFSKLQRVALVFSYYFIYEYAVISRDYAFAVLFVLFFCLAFTSHLKCRFLWSCFCLFLLSQTSIYGVLLSCSFTLILMHDWRKNKLPIKDLISGLALIGFGFTLSLLQIIPPAGGGLATAWITKFDTTLLCQSIEIIYRSFFVIPKIDLHFWNSNIADNTLYGGTLKFVLSIGVLIFTFLIFRRNLVLWIVFLSTSIAIVAFTYIKYYGFLRHHGHIFLCFLVCYWIMQKKEPATNKNKIISNYFFNAILFLQLYASILAVYFEWRYDFSGGKSVSRFLKENHLEKEFISVDTDFTAASVSGYLNRSFFYPQSGRSGTFIIFDLVRNRFLKFDEVYSITQSKTQDKIHPVLYLLNYPIDENKFQVKLLFKQDKTIVYDEQCWVYKQ